MAVSKHVETISEYLTKAVAALERDIADLERRQLSVSELKEKAVAYDRMQRLIQESMAALQRRLDDGTR